MTAMEMLPSTGKIFKPGWQKLEKIETRMTWRRKCFLHVMLSGIKMMEADFGVLSRAEEFIEIGEVYQGNYFILANNQDVLASEKVALQVLILEQKLTEEI